jgi:hypothetical protein
MIVTYALTMSALRQAHTTKKERKKRRERIHAVINLAAMAIRWKRAVNTVEIPDEKKSTTIISQQENEKLPKIFLARKRASSLLTNEHPKKQIFISSQLLNDCPKSLSPINWRKTKDKSLKPLQEKSSKEIKEHQKFIDYSSTYCNLCQKHMFSIIIFFFSFLVEQSSSQHLDPSSLNNSQIHARRSNSCTPLLDVEINRRDQRRSSSVNTLLQIRRDSAKITEELANLTAQLSGSNSKRPSISVPGTSEPNEKNTPTIDQLLKETSVNQPIIIPSSLLTINPRRRGRS